MDVSAEPYDDDEPYRDDLFPDRGREMARRALSAAGPTRLAYARRPGGERTRTFGDDRLGPDGAAQLAAGLGPQHAAIAELDLSHNGVGPAGIAALAPALARLPLRTLDIRGNALGGGGVRVLASALAGKASLEVLRLGENAVRDGRALAAVAELACSLPSLRTLDLDRLAQDGGEADSETFAGKDQDEAVSALSAMLAVHPTLEELGLLGFPAAHTATNVELQLNGNFPADATPRDLLGLRLEAPSMEPFADAIVRATSLRTLRLGGQGALPGGQLAAALARAGRLKVLVLEGRATLAEFEAVCSALASSDTLEDVSLQPTFPRGRSDPNINVREAALLIVGRTLLTCASLRRLTVEDEPYSSIEFDLKHSDEANRGVAALAEALANESPLEELTLLNFCVNDAGLRLLASALQSNETLKVLTLDPSAGGDDSNDGGAAAMAAALAGANRSPRFRPPLPLEVLRLGHHRIGPKGADALADALPRTTSLRELDLSNNRIRSRGAVRLAQGLKRNGSLRRLRLGDNQIGSLGAAALGSCLAANHTLEELGLAGNPIGADGAEELAAGLAKNRGLVTLDLSGCQLGEEGRRALGEAVAVNDTLRNLVAEFSFFGDDFSDALSKPERAANAQQMRRTLEARDQPPQGLACRSGNGSGTATLGSGGFGKVFRGRYLDLDVAVKEPLLRGDEEAEAVLEAEIAASMDVPLHPNVAEILGYHIRPTFLVTRLYNGDLAGFLRDRGWNRALALRLLGDAAQGVRALHAAGIVHADLKPGNVLVDLAPGDPDGRAVAKIADFGLARSRTRVRGAQGTAYEYVGFGGFSLRYASPEQLLGDGIGRASDVWSFGMLCYAILSEGTEPYAGLSRGAVMFHAEQGTLPNPLLRSDDWELVRWICRKEKPERPSAADVAARLRTMSAAAAEDVRAADAAPSGEALATVELEPTFSASLLIALLACALAAAVASAPAAAAPTASNERALFRRSCADCDPSAYCEFAHPGAPPDHVACVSQGTDDGHALYRRYVSPRTFFWSIGGSPDDYAALTAVRYIEPAAASPVWTDAPALSVGRGSNGAGMYSGMANALGSKIYVYGGTDSVVWFSAVMVSLDASNLAAGWTSVALPSVTRNLRYNGVTAELGGVFYYIAGFNANSGNAFVTTTESYEPGTNTWTSSVAGATLPSGVGDTTKSNRGCAVSAAGSLWIVQMAGTAAAAYDPASGPFSSLAASAGAHNYPVAAGCVGLLVAPAVSANPVLAQFMTTVCSGTVPA
ncbi:hypothetical protein DFJ74DRAFT_772370 [Hyaloraphidium curvatum]|nr:hypothetical protein DFJ74DRAFT_772370 [Hyaloraphidium curvatum]